MIFIENYYRKMVIRRRRRSRTDRSARRRGPARTRDNSSRVRCDPLARSAPLRYDGSREAHPLGEREVRIYPLGSLRAAGSPTGFLP